MSHVPEVPWGFRAWCLSNQAPGCALESVARPAGPRCAITAPRCSAHPCCWQFSAAQRNTAGAWLRCKPGASPAGPHPRLPSYAPVCPFFLFSCSSGFGFVTFESDDDAAEAVRKLHGTDWNGR